MIGWSEKTEPPRKRPRISEALRGLLIQDGLGSLWRLCGETQILCHGSAWLRIQEYLAGSRVERGGLLLGQASPRRYGGHWVEVERALVGRQSRGTRVSLELGSQVWDEAREWLDHGLSVVGWYHSHPGLGVFFSGTDHRTQASFFGQPHNVALVVDPQNGNSGWFLGPEARPISPGMVSYLME